MSEHTQFSTAGINLHHAQLVKSEQGFAGVDADVLMLQEIDDPSAPPEPQIELLRERLGATGYNLLHHYGELAIASRMDRDITLLQTHTYSLQRMGRLAAQVARLLPKQRAERFERKFRRDVIGVTVRMPDDEPATFISTHLTTAVHIRERAKQQERFGAITRTIGATARNNFNSHTIIAKMDGNHFLWPGHARASIATSSGLGAVDYGGGDTYNRKALKRHAYLRLYPGPIELDSAYHTPDVVPVHKTIVDLKDTDHFELVTVWERQA